MSYHDSPFVDTEISVPAFLPARANLHPCVFWKFRPCDAIETERQHTEFNRLSRGDPAELFAWLAKANKARVESITFSAKDPLRNLSVEQFAKLKRNLAIDIFLVSHSVVGSEAIPDEFRPFCDVEPSVEKLEKK